MGTTLGNSATALGDPASRWGPRWEIQPPHCERDNGDHIGKFSHHIVRSRHHNGDHIGKFRHLIGRSSHHNGDHIGKFSTTLGDPETTMGTTLGNSTTTFWEIQWWDPDTERASRQRPVVPNVETSCLFALAAAFSCLLALAWGRNGPPGNGL